MSYNPYWLTVTIILSIGIFVGSIGTPGFLQSVGLAFWQLEAVEPMQEQTEGGYTVHFISYFLLGMAVLLAFPGIGALTLALAVSGFGIGIELFQFFLPYRTFDIYDLAFNTAAVFTAVLIMLVTQLRKRF